MRELLVSNFNQSQSTVFIQLKVDACQYDIASPSPHWVAYPSAIIPSQKICVKNEMPIPKSF